MEENTTALNAQESAIEPVETNALETKAVETNEVATAEQEILDEKGDLSEKSLNEILSYFQKMIEKGDQQELYKNAEIIKAAFYKVLRREKLASGMFIEPGMADKEGVTNPFEEVEKAFKDLYGQYKASRNAYNSQMQKQRENNLVEKNKIIESIDELLQKAEDINHTLPAFRELQAKWKEIGSVPQENARELWDRYNHTVERFYDFLKINKEFRDLDFKKNYEAKVVLCEKAEALAESKDIVKAFNDLQKLHEEWKELGPVSKEHREDIWERFRAATSVINKKHQEHFAVMKERQKTNLKLKTELCEQAEQIAATECTDSNMWNSLSKKMDELMVTWRGIGFASKKENQSIYDRFRAACDKFYGSKRQFYSSFKDVMQENLKKKIELCEQAEQIKLSDEWKKATDQLINLQKVWKTIGPVARKHSDAVWKRFRAACDEFFERKAAHFGADKEDGNYEENMAAKKAVIEAIKAYQSSGDEAADKAALTEFLTKWHSIGFVPYKAKDALQKEYDKALNEKFGSIRNLDEERKMGKIRRLINDVKNTGSAGAERGVRAEREKLLNKFHKLESDIATLENNMGFFAKSKNADKLLEDIKKKIEAGKAELKQLEEKIKMIDKEF